MKKWLSKQELLELNREHAIGEKWYGMGGRGCTCIRKCSREMITIVGLHTPREPGIGKRFFLSRVGSILGYTSLPYKPLRYRIHVFIRPEPLSPLKKLIESLKNLIGIPSHVKTTPDITYYGKCSVLLKSLKKKKKTRTFSDR